MALFNYLVCIALLCGVSCSPLGAPGSVYDYSSLLPVPNQLTTVCETSPNVVGLGLGIGYPYVNNYPLLPLPYPKNIWANNPNIQSTTVCETTSTPNVVSILPFPNLPIPGVSSTVCETTPSVVGFLPFPNVPNLGGVSTTVCESTPSVVGFLPFPNPTVAPVPESTTIVQTPVLPVNPCISPLPYPGLIPGYPYGVPLL